MTSTWRLRYAPVVRIDEARIDIPGATKNYVPTALVGEVNPVLFLPAVGITVQPTRGGYLAVSYSIITPITDFTIVIPPDFDHFDTFVPCVSWIENTLLRRFRLTNVPVGEVPFPLYKGQLIDAASAVIELWARGDNDHLTIADWFLRVGLLEVPGRAEQLVGSTYITEPCIAAVQGDPALFASYLMSCARGSFVPPPPIVATPVITPPTGTYAGIITVTIECATLGAFKYFTIDNSLPSPASTLYTGPFTVPAGTVVKAMAAFPGSANSFVATVVYTKAQAATPVLSPGSRDFSGVLIVTASTGTPGASMAYTLDGTLPTPASFPYTGPLILSDATTVVIMAFAPGYSDSGFGIGHYTLVVNTVATPIISPASGTYGEPITVSMTCATFGAAMRFTIDGSDPIFSSPHYLGPFVVSVDTVVKVLALKPGLINSPIVEADYVITPSAVADPVFNPVSGNFSTPFSVVISTTTFGASIYYTIRNNGISDPPDPTPADILYTGPILVDNDTVIKAIAIKTGLGNSGIARGEWLFVPSFDVSWQVIIGLEDGAGGPVVFANRSIYGDYSMDAFTSGPLYSAQWECPIAAPAPTAFLASSGGPFVTAPMNSAPPFVLTDANGFPYADAGTARLYQTTAIYPQHWTLRIT